MAIKKTAGFKLDSPQQNFVRDSFATVAAMVEYSEALLPPVFKTMCEEDGCIYLYNVNNETDETLGKWRKLESDAVMKDTFTTNTEVGGIPSGTSIEEGDSISTLLKNMLYKYIAPTLTFKISPTTTTYNIVSDTADKTITLTGSYSGGTSTGTRTASYSFNGTACSTSVTMNNTTGTADSYGNMKNTFVYTVNDEVQDTTKTITVSYNYPRYYGLSSTISATPTASEIAGLTTTTLTASKGYTGATVSGTGRICYAYPAAYGNLTSIKDPNGFSMMESVTKTTVTVNGISYNVYTLTDAATVSSFNLTYA